MLTTSFSEFVSTLPDEVQRKITDFVSHLAADEVVVYQDSLEPDKHGVRIMACGEHLPRRRAADAPPYLQVGGRWFRRRVSVTGRVFQNFRTSTI